MVNFVEKVMEGVVYFGHKTKILNRFLVTLFSIEKDNAILE